MHVRWRTGLAMSLLWGIVFPMLLVAVDGITTRQAVVVGMMLIVASIIVGAVVEPRVWHRR